MALLLKAQVPRQRHRHHAHPHPDDVLAGGRGPLLEDICTTPATASINYLLGLGFLGRARLAKRLAVVADAGALGGGDWWTCGMWAPYVMLLCPGRPQAPSPTTSTRPPPSTAPARWYHLLADHAAAGGAAAADRRALPHHRGAQDLRPGHGHDRRRPGRLRPSWSPSTSTGSRSWASGKTGKSSALAYIVLVIITAVSNLYVQVSEQAQGCVGDERR
jgi:hypothetical protein